MRFLSLKVISVFLVLDMWSQIASQLGWTNLHSILLLLNKIVGHLQPCCIWNSAENVPAAEGREWMCKCVRSISLSLTGAISPVTGQDTKGRRLLWQPTPRNMPADVGSWAFPAFGCRSLCRVLLHVTHMRGWMWTLDSASVIWPTNK